jgi:ATP-binding protein involved in chromosome partitioning
MIHKGHLAKYIIAVASGKGGVGKSTTAIYLAYALSQMGQRVGFLDADIYGPSLPTLLGEASKPDINAHNHMIPLLRNGVQFMSMGFLLEPTTPVIWRGPMVSQAIQKFLKEVAWENLDILILDLPPGTGDVQLTLLQQTVISGALIVSTPQDLALVDALKALTMFQKINVPILGIVENMSHFECPHCHERSDIFHHGGAEKMAQKQDISFLGSVPLDPHIRLLCDQGRPQDLLTDPRGEPYLTLAQQLMKKLIEITRK